MGKFAAICLGGALGTGARYLLSGWALALLGTSFPYGTLLVNILGSFSIGLIMHLGLSTEMISPTTRIILTTGVMGGFTTYSSFNYETLRIFQEGSPLKGVANILLMVVACLVAGLLGLALARKWAGT